MHFPSCMELSDLIRGMFKVAMELTTTGQETDLQATGLGVKREQFVSKYVDRDGSYEMNVVIYSRGAFGA